MKVTYFGTTMLLFDDGTDQILFDCHITRPSIPKFLFKKIKPNHDLANAVINNYCINRLKAIFISHSHYDHVLDASYFSNRCNSDIYGSKSTINVCKGDNVEENKLHIFDDSTYTIGKFKITVIKSKHSKPKFFNNDIGKTIDEPLIIPARARKYKEGGSYDFLIEHNKKKYLIRPSYSHVEGELNKVKADVLFLGISGLSKDNKDNINTFFRETVDKVKAKKVIPIHWDNFFKPLYKKSKGLPRLFENTKKSIKILEKECINRNIDYILLMPLDSIDL